MPGAKQVSGSEASVYSDRFIKIMQGGSRGVVFLNPGGNIRFNTLEDYDSVAEMLAGMGAPQFVYPLEEPVTYQLTPTQIELLKGSNTLWMDADGTIDLTYNGDIKTYIDAKIAELQALVLENA